MEVEREEEKKRISNMRKTAFCKKVSRGIAISKSNAISGGNAFFAAAKKHCHAFKFVIIKTARYQRENKNVHNRVFVYVIRMLKRSLYANMLFRKVPTSIFSS